MTKRCNKCRRNRDIAEFAKHPSTRDGRQPTCRKCHKRIARTHYQANKQGYKQRAAAWAAANPEKRKATASRYMRKQRREDPEPLRRINRRWKRRNRLRCAENENRRRARKLGAPEISKVDREVIYARDNGRCHLCRRPVSRKRMELDHVVPLARGGRHTASNLKVAHPRCNRRKWAHLV